jgi:hypothetical protein
MHPNDPLTDSDFWDIDASVIPWTAGFSKFDEAEPAQMRRAPYMFYPSTQQAAVDFQDGNSPSSRERPFHTSTAPCYVILFGVGEESMEGIYTLRTQEPDGLTNVDTVVAFESEVDAQRFATLLEATMVHKPSVFSISWGDVTDWCNESNTRCRLEPAGSLFIPPEANVGVTDWERALALQRGEFRVLDSEPAVGSEGGLEHVNGSFIGANDDVASVGNGFFIDGPDWVFNEEDDQLGNASNVMDDVLADAASLAAIRASLERLLNH